MYMYVSLSLSIYIYIYVYACIYIYIYIYMRSAFKEGSLRGEITRRTRTARDTSRETTAPPLFSDIP